MDILTAQWLTLVGFFAAMIISCLGPVWFMHRRESAFESRRYNFFLGLANCLSAGVFLATFFVGLLPEVRRQFQALLHAHQIITSFPVTEFIVFLGFSMALFIEQLLLSCRRKSERASPPPPPFREEEAEDESGPISAKRNGESYADESATNDGHWKYVKLKNNYISESSGFPDGDERHCEYHSSELNHNHPKEHSTFQPVSHDSPGSHSHHHHHGHSHDISAAVDPDSGVRFGLLLMSLGVHSAFEGMTLGLQTRIPELINLFIGVLIHECLVAFAVGVSVAKMKLRPWTTLQLIVLFSSTIPAGQLFGLLLGNHQSAANDTVSAVLQAVAAGTFIHVTFLEVIPEGLGDGDASLLKVLFLFLGFAIIAAIPLIVDVHDHRSHAGQEEFKALLQLRRNLGSL